MFLILAVVLFVVWIGSFLVFKSAGLLLHLLLLFAVLSGAFFLFRASRERVPMGAKISILNRGSS